MKHRTGPGRTLSDFEITLVLEGEEWAGEIEHVYFSETYSFSRLDEMIFLLHGCLENIGHPQTTATIRSWSVSEEPEGRCKRGDHRLKKTGSKAQYQRKSGAPTFFIRIHFRQNVTWQGSIQWLEGGGSRQFRSMLEMIMLMKEAVDMSGDSEIVLSSWADQEENLS